MNDELKSILPEHAHLVLDGMGSLTQELREFRGIEVMNRKHGEVLWMLTGEGMGYRPARRGIHNDWRDLRSGWEKR